MNKIFKKASQIVIAAAAVVSIAAGNAFAGIESINNYENPAAEGAKAVHANGTPSELLGVDGIFTKLANTVLYAVGIISVVMLIYGGLRYVVSGGDSKKVTDAKNTILYAIVGLIISILSFSIINFIINAVSGVGK